MKMIPPYPIAKYNIAKEVDEISSGEKRTFELLKSVNFDSSLIAFHSLNISEHDYKKWGEIDFIILGETGLYIIEVKAGQIRVDNDGIWHTKNRYGQENRLNESPMDQARSAAYNLLDMIKRDTNLDIKKYHNFGCGVVLTNTPWRQKSAGMPTEVVCDRDYMEPVKFERFIKNLIKHYNESNKSKLSQKNITTIQEYLRPTFDRSPSLSQMSDELYNKLHKLTEEQWVYFRSSQRNSRLICVGGAGSGKSVLARHVALEKAGEGMKVLLTAKHPILISYLKEQIKKFDTNIDEIDVLSFDEVKKNIDYYENYFDFLVVDEAQDLMNFESLDVLEKVLVNGLEKGVWRFFMDDNGQANIIGKFNKDAYEYLKENSARSDLFFNCRNTNQIIQAATAFSKARIGEAKLNSHGVEVDTKHYENEEEKIIKISDILEDFRKEGIALSDIAILSFVNTEKSCVQNLEKNWLDKIIVLNKDNVIRKSNKISFCNIADFKGLEKRNIILTDIDAINVSKDVLKSYLYTGMTRAQIKLCVIIKKQRKLELMTEK